MWIIQFLILISGVHASGRLWLDSQRMSFDLFLCNIELETLKYLLFNKAMSNIFCRFY